MWSGCCFLYPHVSLFFPLCSNPRNLISFPPVNLPTSWQDLLICYPPIYQLEEAGLVGHHSLSLSTLLFEVGPSLGGCRSFLSSPKMPFGRSWLFLSVPITKFGVFGANGSSHFFVPLTSDERPPQTSSGVETISLF